MSSKINILIITDSLSHGGIETYVLNLCKSIDKSKFNVTVMLTEKDRNALTEHIVAQGCTVYAASKKSTPSLLMLLSRIIVSNKIDIVHMQIRHSSLVLLSKMFGRKTVLHSHFGPSPDGKSSGSLGYHTRLVHRLCSRLVACSEVAGRCAFGDVKFSVLENGTEIDRYKFSKSDRVTVRKGLGIGESSLVLIQVGRLNNNKNQLFTLEVFRAVVKTVPSARLILIGDGEGRELVESKIKKYGIRESTTIVGSTEEVSKYYSAADILIQPSAFGEGLPYVLIEAQANGIQCVVSDIISAEANYTGLITYLSLNLTAEDWASEVIQRAADHRCDKDFNAILEQSKFNAQNSIHEVERLYLSLKARRSQSVA